MKKLLIVLAVLTMAVSPVLANQTYKATLNSVLTGGLSYDKTGANVVTSGTAFMNAISAAGNPVSTQKVSGDNIDNPVTGNFAFFGVFTYTDNGALAYAASNPDQLLSLEFNAHTLQFYLSGIGTYDEYLAIDGRDSGVPLLATFSELGDPGCTEIAAGIWMDIWTGEYLGQDVVALSFVIDGFSDDDTDALLDSLGMTTANADLLAGDLNTNYDTNRWRISSVAITPVPVPGAVVLGGIGISLIGWMKRRKSL